MFVNAHHTCFVGRLIFHKNSPCFGISWYPYCVFHNGAISIFPKLRDTAIGNSIMTKLNFTSNNFSHSHQNQYIVNCAPMHRTESCTRQFHIILFNVLFNVQICFWVESVFIEFVELNLIFQSVDYRNWCFLFPLLNLQIQIVWSRSLLNRLVVVF